MAELLFWCVWCEQAGPPTVRHAEFASAKAEAQRLARAHPGRRFVVLAAAVAFEMRDLDEIRFVARGTVGEYVARVCAADEDDGNPF